MIPQNIDIRFFTKVGDTVLPDNERYVIATFVKDDGVTYYGQNKVEIDKVINDGIISINLAQCLPIPAVQSGSMNVDNPDVSITNDATSIIDSPGATS